MLSCSDPPFHVVTRQLIDDTASRPLGVDQPAPVEAGEVLGDVRLRETGCLDDLPHCLWPVTEREEAGESSGIGESAKEVREQWGSTSRGCDHSNLNI